MRQVKQAVSHQERRAAAVLAIGILGMASTPIACGAAARTHEFELDNGLKVIVHEDHRAPVAVVQVWYRIGSSHETDGTTGVSHVLEHMMFQGTKDLGPGEFSRVVAENGGNENAFTGTDYTAYFQQWGADNVELSFKLESDRMQNLALTQTEFSKEINVVKEERRLRTEDNPRALAYETTLSVAFQTSPYRQPIIGWLADLDHMTVADLQGWYQQWYAPNNAVVIVLGDVHPEEIRKLAQRHFGPLPRRELTPTKPRPEKEQRGEKRVIVNSESAKLPFLMLGYKAPVLPMARQGEAEEWEIYALDVLAAILDGDGSARLSRELIRGRELAVTAGAGYSATDRLQTLFYFEATPRPGVDLAMIEQAIKGEIEKLRATPPTDAELARVKTQVVAETLYQQDSLFYQGMAIGSLEAIGLSWRLKDEYVERIKQVTADQVQAVARKYLVDSASTVAYLLPVEAQ